MTIQEYKKRRDRVFKSSEGDIFKPCHIAEILGVSYTERDIVPGDKKWPHYFGETMEVGLTTSINDLKEFGVSDLKFVYVVFSLLNHFFIMDNQKVFVVKHSCLMSCHSKYITGNLLSIFEEFKIRRLEDESSWVPILNRFEILDL